MTDNAAHTAIRQALTNTEAAIAKTTANIERLNAGITSETETLTTLTNQRDELRAALPDQDHTR